jgi:hypothetical protein
LTLVNKLSRRKRIMMVEGMQRGQGGAHGRSEESKQDFRQQNSSEAGNDGGKESAPGEEGSAGEAGSDKQGESGGRDQAGPAKGEETCRHPAGATPQLR